MIKDLVKLLKRPKKWKEKEKQHNIKEESTKALTKASQRCKLTTTLKEERDSKFALIKKENAMCFKSRIWMFALATKQWMHL